EIELDAKVVLGWVTEEFNSNLHHASLILDCRTLANQIPQVRMKYCIREANKCANALARTGLDSNQDFMLLDSTLVGLCIQLFCDNSGLYYERLRPLYTDFV
ncbi:hypothetical protein SO802_008341, partial [Lithocarpus litseifolius]